MRPLTIALSACLLLAAPVAAQVLPEQTGDAPSLPTEDPSSEPDWDQGLVWGLGAGGLGLAAVAGLLYYLGVGGLRHIDKHNVLEHPLRRSLLDAVEGSPGVHLRELASRHDTAVTNTQWHLRKLEMAGLVKTEKVQGRRLYYPTRGGVAAKEEALQNAAVQNPNAQRLLEFIQANPGSNQRRLADSLSMNPGTVRWHLRKMDGAGLVRCIQDGAQTCYFPVRQAPGVRRPERPVRETVQVEQREA